MEEPLSIKATLLSKTEREFEIPKSQLSFALNKTYEKEIYENFGVVFHPLLGLSHLEYCYTL